MTFICSTLVVGAVIAVFLVYIFMAYEPTTWLNRYLTKSTDPAVFAALMALLPLAGAPISIFLVLVGIIFGLGGGILLTGVLSFFHVVVTWYLVHSIFRPLVLRLLNRTHVAAPRLPRRGRKRLAFIFMLIPGLPYAVKNYLLALSGLPFLQYTVISWSAQFVLCIPFIMLGKAVIKMDPAILGAAVCIILLGFAGQVYLKRHYSSLRQQTAAEISPADDATGN